jgi:hypothetical protein
MGIVSKHLYKVTRASGPPKIHPQGGVPGGWFWCDIGAVSPPIKPGMATLVLIHSMIGIKWGKFLALAHFKTRKRILK